MNSDLLTVTPYGRIETLYYNFCWLTIVRDAKTLNQTIKSTTLFEARAVHTELVGQVWDAGLEQNKGSILNTGNEVASSAIDVI
jgi:hypothetical protein